MIKINQKIEVEIVDVNYEGNGVAKVDGVVIFVSNALTGEVILVKIDKVGKNFGTAHPIHFIKLSDKREKQLCGSFPQCGGCQLLHMKYPATLELKKQGFIQTMKRIAKIDADVESIKGMENPFGYRNKVQIPVGVDTEGNTVFGYFQKGTHIIIPFEDCLVETEEMSTVIKYVREICNDLRIKGYDEATHKGLLKHLIIRENNEKKLMIIFVTYWKEIKEQEKIATLLTNRFPNVVSIVNNIKTMHNNVILGKTSKVLFGKDKFIDKLGNVSLYVSHQSFFQINRTQTEVLYEIIKENVGKDSQNILDCYCGVGSISLYIAKDNPSVKKVLGIESVRDAINMANMNKKMNNIENVHFEVGKVENKIYDAMHGDIDTIILDPPRKGLDPKVVNTILTSHVDKIIYVSCNPATLARDIELLSKKYEIKRINLVDMFCFTTAVECVIKLEKVK